MKTFKEDIERDAMILQAQLSGKTLSWIASSVMKLPEFAGGPDRLIVYARWISHPSRREYRRKVAIHMLEMENHLDSSKGNSNNQCVDK